ncbi:MAG: tol-pal system protein YbgF [Nitrospirae bacterium]|nr:MAG: tol-pal system protein YbgF [Nitrospirota bacterium]
MERRDHYVPRRPNHVIKKIGGFILYYLSKYTLAFLVLSMFLINGCATVREVDMIKYNLVDMRARLNKMEDRLEQIDKQLPGGGENLKQDILDVKKEETVLKRNQTDMFKRLNEFEKEMQQINDRLDRLEASLGVKWEESEGLSGSKKTLRQEIEELREEIKQLSTASGQHREETSYGEPPSLEEVKPKEKEKTVVKDDKAIYTEARELYTKGDTKKARELFELLLREYPESKYADNAMYWIGECYYREGDYDSAILAFEELLTKYPNSPKAPAAMLKQGYSFYKRGDRENGKYILEKLIEKYPGTEEAKLAKNRIGADIRKKRRR